jgi:hypothetical protein
MQIEILQTGGRIITVRGLTPIKETEFGEFCEMNEAFPLQEQRNTAEAQLLKMLVAAEAKQFSAFAGCSFIAGLLLFLVPVIGWIIGFIFIIIGVSGLIFPSITYKLFDRDGYTSLKQAISIRVKNCYQNVFCPYCSTFLTKENEGFCFYDDPEGFDCPYCKKRLIRKSSRISKA